MSVSAIRQSSTRALSSGARLVSQMSRRNAHTLPELPYSYGALEPHISGQIMEIHHAKHHQTYVNNLNAALDTAEQLKADGDVSGLVGLQGAIKFNGGGHVNHTLFWNNLAPTSEGGGVRPEGALSDAINAQFGSYEAFEKSASATAAAIQGSGWYWLVKDPSTGAVRSVTSSNQDTVSVVAPGAVPLIGIDMWEHAYYLQYKNVRPDYLSGVWNVINWQEAMKRYSA